MTTITEKTKVEADKIPSLEEIVASIPKEFREEEEIKGAVGKELID